MMPCDWIGMVTIRRLTLRRSSTSGMMNVNPGARTPTTRPSRNSTPCSYCLTMRSDNARTISATTSRQMTMMTTSMSRPHREDHCGVRQ